jgi:alkanesulfonate monooxygenase SsuD/methylene tetrahydromethanopterin reductase-like flavin-dependent oxidoreductase (luciferase family)
VRLRRWLIGSGAAVFVLVAVAGVLYLFGGEQPPSASVRAAYAAEVAAGRQPALAGRFVVPIPGCVCHSDDPVLQMQHAARRMSECSGCHDRG